MKSTCDSFDTSNGANHGSKRWACFHYKVKRALTPKVFDNSAMRCRPEFRQITVPIAKFLARNLTNSRDDFTNSFYIHAGKAERVVFSLRHELKNKRRETGLFEIVLLSDYSCKADVVVFGIDTTVGNVASVGNFSVDHRYQQVPRGADVLVKRSLHFRYEPIKFRIVTVVYVDGYKSVSAFKVFQLRFTSYHPHARPPTDLCKEKSSMTHVLTQWGEGQNSLPVFGTGAGSTAQDFTEIGFFE